MKGFKQGVDWLSFREREREWEREGETLIFFPDYSCIISCFLYVL